jgi:surface carbohydrate biosynthesis protein
MKFLERKKVDIVIFVEHKDRELQLSNYLKEELERENYSVIIASLIYHTHLILYKYKIKTIITPYIGFGKGSISDLFYKAHGLNINFINLNYEQFLFPFTGKFKIPKNNISKNYQINFAWGNHFKKYLVEAGAKTENIFITGRPYSEVIKKIEINKKLIKNELAEAHQLDVNKQWVFIALTDGLALLDNSSLEKIVSKGVDGKGMYTQVYHDRETILKLCKILSNISNLDDNENYEFILRPHPSVSINKYKSIFSNNNLNIPVSLKLIKESSALNWLVSSDMLITNYSTLIIDATALNKKTLVFNHDNVKFNYLWWTSFADDNFEDFQELNQYLKKSKKTKDHKADDFYIEKINGVSESAKIILKYTRLKSKYSEASLNNLLKIFFTEKRVLGAFIRNTILTKFNNPFGIIKKSMSIDYFKINNNEI